MSASSHFRSESAFDTFSSRVSCLTRLTARSYATPQSPSPLAHGLGYFGGDLWFDCAPAMVFGLGETPAGYITSGYFCSTSVNTRCLPLDLTNRRVVVTNLSEGMSCTGQHGSERDIKLHRDGLRKEYESFGLRRAAFLPRGVCGQLQIYTGFRLIVTSNGQLHSSRASWCASVTPYARQAH